MTLQKLPLQAGADREPTSYANENYWFNMDKVRFRAGYPEKIGGWTKAITDEVNGVTRALLQWTALDGTSLLAIGTSTKLYVEFGDTAYDITPIRRTQNRTDPFTFTNGSAVVVVTDAGHGAGLGDSVTFSGVVGSTYGIPASELNAEHVITRIIDSSSYEVQVTTSANTTGTPAVGSITLTYQINRGLDVAVVGTGWGTGPWSRGTWGSSFSSSNITNQLRLWTLDNFGEDLVANVAGGSIYYWDYTSGAGSPAVELSTITGASSVPTVANCIAVTDDRHLVAFGCDPITDVGNKDPLLIRWSDQENILEWFPAIDNTAGDYRLDIGTKIVAVQRTRTETLVWTDSALYSMQFSGPPYTFSFTLLAQNISIGGLNAKIDIAGRTYWMGNKKFYNYAGQAIPLPCKVRKYIFDDFNYTQMQQVFTGTVEEYNEVWWFYPSSNAMLPDRYVIYNYVDDTWAIGNLARTAWIDSKERGYPIAANSGVIYLHEVGTDDATNSSNPVAIEAYCESADFDIGDGDHISMVRRIMPDVSFEGSTAANPSIDITVAARVAPGGSFYRTAGMPVQRTVTVPVEEFTTQAWIRIRGRQMKFKVSSDDLGVAWHLGACRLDIQQDGRSGGNG